MTATDSANEALGKGYSALSRIGAQRAWTLGGLVVALVAFSIYAIVNGGRVLFVQRLIDGLSNGFIYSAMALALVLIYKATTVVNFAQGEMAMFGAFLCYVFDTSLGLPTWLAIIAGMAVSALAAAGIERVLIRPF
ncbi:MAG: hypothetical protein ABIQ39_13800, partial [Ilumatobacteraceae bacterium]